MTRDPVKYDAAFVRAWLDQLADLTVSTPIPGAPRRTGRPGRPLAVSPRYILAVRSLYAVLLEYDRSKKRIRSLIAQALNVDERPIRDIVRGTGAAAYRRPGPMALEYKVLRGEPITRADIRRLSASDRRRLEKFMRDQKIVKSGT